MSNSLKAHSLLLGIFFVCSIYSLPSFSQQFIPKNPLEIKPSLAGNYGELRPNHFHAGIDLKTAGREGLNVLSAGDGFVSRVKISPYGYGKAVYIDHPEGYTTVYAHLQEGLICTLKYARQKAKSRETLFCLISLYQIVKNLFFKQ